MDGPYELLQSGAFSRQNTMAKTRQAIVATPRVIQCCGRPAVRRLDEPHIDQTPYCSVQCWWPQSDLTFCPFKHILHDSVTMLVLARKRQEHVKPVGFEWKKAFG
jgi:hypothetical protein